MPPKVLKNPDRASDVLPVNAAQRAVAKAPVAKLKLHIRRLPPGLTLTELEEILGDLWKLDNGKVDWREYRSGKVKAPGKQHQQSVCYIHVVNAACVEEVMQRHMDIMASTGYHDKAGTWNFPELKSLPPQIGYADNQRTPLNNKQRADTRQGTIDQDPEYMAFLEEQTQAIVKPQAVDAASDKADRPVVKSTPLIDDLREKKANKAKAASNKADKKKEEDKKEPEHRKNTNKVANVDGKASQSSKVELAAKEAAKALNKQAASRTATQPSTVAGKSASPSKAKKSAPSPRQQNATLAQPVQAPEPRGPGSPAPNRMPPGQRPRGNAEGIKKMLHKDLGLRPKAAPGNQAKPAQQPSSVGSSNVTSPSSTPAQSAQQGQPPPTAPKSQQQPKSTIPQAAAPGISTTKAYLKHANPSQGMTEMLILQALSQYGPLTNVTIDPRKGTAIAMFKDNEGLKKAMDAKTVAVANGAVEIHQFRENGARGGGGPALRGRGGFRGGRGGRGGAAVNAAPGASAQGGTTPTPRVQ